MKQALDEAVRRRIDRIQRRVGRHGCKTRYDAIGKDGGGKGPKMTREYYHSTSVSRDLLLSWPDFELTLAPILWKAVVVLVAVNGLSHASQKCYLNCDYGAE